MSKPVPTLISYFPKPGKGKELLALIEKHWPILDKGGLVTKTKAKVWKAHDKRQNTDYFIEYMEWKDGESSGLAHQLPEVMAVWETMGPIMETMSIVQIEELPMPY